MHTAENKQNYSFPKYLRVESLKEASNLSCRSKIERRSRQSPFLRSPSGLQTNWFPDLGAHFSLKAELEGSQTGLTPEKMGIPKA
jgi:hypothetical protein